MKNFGDFRLSRRAVLAGTAGLAGATLLPRMAFAEDQPPIGTWPDGSSGDTVNIGVAVPRTGSRSDSAASGGRP